MTIVRTEGARSRRIKSFAAILAMSGVMLACGCKSSGGAGRYDTETVARGRIVAHVTASGTLSAVVSVDVGCRVSGQISGLYVDFNSRVRKGELIAEIDPTIYQAAVDQARGDLASARANMTLKRENLERKKTLFPLRAASRADLDEAEAELAQAQAAVEVDEAAVASARANLGYTRIAAPVDGVVISRDVDLGQTVNAAMSTPILFTIAQDISKMNIKADVSEADIGQVKAGQPVDFTVDAFPDDVFRGTVSQVRKSPTVTQNVVTYQVVISLDNPEEELFPGMTANVSIRVAERDNALKIPNTALRFTPPDDAAYEGSAPTRLPGNERLVFTTDADGMRLRPVVVKTGITNGINTEILGGLDVGEGVVVATVSAEANNGGFSGPPMAAPQ